jgi:hypothetical protein
VADRWHLFHNLTKAIDKAIRAHRECLIDPVEDKDYDAVRNGLTLEWSSGAVEGNVNRIILWNLKCQVRPGSGRLDRRNSRRPMI